MEKSSLQNNESFLQKKYFLKHKDIDVLSFVFNQRYEITEVLDVLNEEHIPVGVKNNEVMSLTDALQDWWKHRSIPASRNNLEQGLTKLNIKITSELLEKSFGLSLTDHYWICPEGANLQWHKINYYENPFSEDIGKILFDNSLISGKKINFYSPDNSSDGNLQKKWIVEQDGKRALIKGGDIFSPQESFNEVIAAEIFRRLDIPHANYEIVSKDDKKIFYSKTTNFTTETIEFINANHIVKAFKYDESSIYEFFVRCCEKSGLERELFEKTMNQMFLVDFIVLNKDRHFRNFGFLRNSETLEWLGFAPVFDTGNSLYEGLADIDLKDSYFLDSKNTIAKPFASNHYDQIKMLPVKKFCSNLNFDSLNDIDVFVASVLEPNTRLSEERKSLVSKNIKERVNLAKELLQ